MLWFSVNKTIVIKSFHKKEMSRCISEGCAMVRGKEACSTSSALLPRGASGWDILPCYTATCLMLGELPSMNLSSVTYVLGFLGLCKVSGPGAQCRACAGQCLIHDDCNEH